MMMAATRRSFRTRRTSPKAKRRSRKNHHDDHHQNHDSDEQRHRSSEHASFHGEADRTEGGSRKSYSSSSRSSSVPPPPPVLSRHGGDVGDSGIDSGNGHAEPESPLVRLGDKGSDRASARHQVPAEHSNPLSPERRKRRSREASVSSNDNSPLREASDGMHALTSNVQMQQSDEASLSDSSNSSSKTRCKSRHRRRMRSESEEEEEEELEQKSPVRENPSVPNHVDRNVSGAHPRSRTDPPLSSHVSEDSDTSSDSPKHARQQQLQLVSKEKDLVISVPESNRRDNLEKDSKGSSESESEGSGKYRADHWKPMDAISVTSDERRDRKRKLEARLQQAKHSLASPHITAAVEAFEFSKSSLPGPQDVSLLHEFRRLFQQELIRLRLELDTFRHFCSKQMEKEAENVVSRHNDKQAGEGDREKEEEQTAAKETAKERNDGSDARTKETQGQRSEETKEKVPEELEQWEESLIVRQKDLHEYESEILEVEKMLNQRQAICERRQSALLALDEELQSLREDIFSKKEVIKKDDDTTEERARKNWDIVRRHLTDKQAMLEAAVQRYRTQIAGSNAALAAKDTLIAHFQKQLKESHETLQARDRKVRQLESKLVLAAEEMHVLAAMRDPSSHDTSPHDPDADPLAQSHTSFTRRRASPLRRGSSRMERGSDAGRGRSPVSDATTDATTAASSPDPTTKGPAASHRALSAPPVERPRRMSSAQIVPDPVSRGKSSGGHHLSRNRPMSARERRMQQRRSSVAAAASAGGGGGVGGGGEGVNSAACAIL